MLLHTRLPRATLSVGLFLAAALGSCTCDDELYTLPGSLTGQLCSVEDGQPLSNHPVELETVDEIIETETDLFGKYKVDGIAPGPVTVRAEVDGQERLFEAHVNADEETTVADEQCRAPPPPPPPPLGTVSGCACDEDEGAWVASANVFIVPPSGDILVATTDSVGCFLLEGVPTGGHVLKIEQGAFYEEHDVQVLEGQDTRIETPDTCEAPEPPPPPPPGTGTVEGRVCAPDGSTWLSAATVWIELDDGTRVEATTDAEGRYRLEGAPAGTQTLHIQKGSFYTTIPVDVPVDGVLTLDDAECAIEHDVRIAVVSGAYDDVRSVLLNVGIDAASIVDYAGSNIVGLQELGTPWATELLSNYDQLAQYDIVFFNCGVYEDEFIQDAQAGGVMRDNLRQFVENGGSIYASDQAYDLVERTFPEFVDFAQDDSVWNDAQRGKVEPSLTGTVTDLTLAQALGQNTLELHYPLVAWAAMESVAAQVRVYIRANATIGLGVTGVFTQTLSNVPHTVGFQVGQGQVIYTSFHQEPGINVQMERVLQLLVFEL